MPLTAAISNAEITAQVQARFIGKYVEAVLVNAPSVVYTPGTTNDTNFLSGELTHGAAGYERAIINFQPADITAYTDGGVGMATKGTIFEHDGNTSTTMDFTHAALVWGAGNVITLDVATNDPDAGNDGVYTDIPTVTTGSGVGLSVDIVVSNNVFAFSPSKAGRGYSVGDTITVEESVMLAAGITTASLEVPNPGSASMDIGVVSENPQAGQLIAVAQTSSPVSLGNGNQAAFYWDFKQFGFS